MNERATMTTSTPVPDPTVLTTQALLREIDALEKLMEQRIHGLERAVSVAHENLVRVPTDVDKAIGHLREVFDEQISTLNEKFVGIGTQFRERDIRVEQTARASKEALDAALQAAKEAVGKQNDAFATAINKLEFAIAKQIEQLVLLQNTTVAALNSKLDDLKERLGRTDTAVAAQQAALLARGEVTANVKGTSNLAANWFGVVVGAILAMIGLISLAIKMH
jgi:hypothetical protein